MIDCNDLVIEGTYLLSEVLGLDYDSIPATENIEVSLCYLVDYPQISMYIDNNSKVIKIWYDNEM